MIAALPENEAERLEALYATELLDTLPEQDFDDLTRLAATICGTPIALVTLLDEHRQWFKSRIGVDVPETSRDVAFCAHAILQPNVFVVSDATKDRRFSANPFVTGEPNVRFYAGVPLETESGHRLGTLCVIDSIPRKLSQEHQNALSILARQVMTHINLRRRTRDLERAFGERDLVEQELRSSQNLFNAFMDHGPFLGFVKDVEGRWIYYNRRTADCFGISRDGWLGKTDAELWPEELARKLRSDDLQVLAQEGTVVIEEQTDTSTQKGVQWRTYKFPITDPAGRRYLAGVCVDITKDKEASEQILRYQEELEIANTKLTEISVTDSLTGLRNRRAFEGALDREFENARYHGTELSLLLLDVDNFKGINDRFGHVGGDRVLQHIADSLRRSFRGTDLVARYGGEEFAVLLPDTGGSAACDLATQLCQRLPEVQFQQTRITVSIGVITMQPEIRDADHLVRLADEALYRAKHEGKNRVVCAGATSTQSPVVLANSSHPAAVEYREALATTQALDLDGCHEDETSYRPARTMMWFIGFNSAALGLWFAVRETCRLLR